MSTYMTSLACLLYCRLRNPRCLAKARWSLGRWGSTVNVGALTYSAFVFFWSFWPDFTPVTLENFNWAPIMFSVTLVVAYTYWLLLARHTYVPLDAGGT
jgi:choline transport protein